MNLVRSADPNYGAAAVGNEPSYWREENHAQEENYLRAEEWADDVREFMLPGKHKQVVMSSANCSAILRYREELKMYAALHNEKLATSGKTVDAMLDPDFLDQQHSRVLEEWPRSEMRKQWLSALMDLQTKLQDIIVPLSGGAFVKLSVRSPKDAALCMPNWKSLAEEQLGKSTVAATSDAALGDDVSVVRWASWQVRCAAASPSASFGPHTCLVYNQGAPGPDRCRCINAAITK
jgi:hypothetical protein